MTLGFNYWCSRGYLSCIVISIIKECWYNCHKNVRTWKSNKVNNELDNSRYNAEYNHYFQKMWLSFRTLITLNQEPLRYVTVMKSGLILMEGRTSSSALTSSFKVKKCEGCKLENEHHSSARYFSLHQSTVNTLCHPHFFTNPRSTLKISITTSHWTGKYITHHLATWIETGGLMPWPNSPTYAVPPLSTIRYSSSMDTIVILTIVP